MSQTPAPTPTAITARELFEKALALPEEERRRLLDEMRLIAPEVCAEVESLLGFHERDNVILDRFPAEQASGGFGPDGTGTARGPGHADAPTAEPIPERIGAYAILRVLGTGGMGVVYEARQDSPRRTVALKVIRRGLLAPGLLKRFSHEAAALARLQHPGIAQVYEAGTVESEGPGSRTTPFIAMELVTGLSLTEHARRLATRDRLVLFAKVCDAVEHAHRRNVVHRDLKPGNILVDAEGNPKILDFGVARLTDAEARLTTITTSVGQIIGTLSYMSPEQATGNPDAIDHRADVYALGVILYELLTGRLPIDPGDTPVHEALRAIATDEPRSVSVFDKRLRGDLDTITRRALEKDKTHRYQHAGDLATDVRHFLNHEPINARPHSAIYQLGKFARRNRALVAGVIAVFVTLIAGIVATSWQAFRAGEQAERAKESAAFLRRMIAGATPEVARGREVTVREMLDRAAADLARDSSVHPAVGADAHLAIAEAYGKIGDFKKAETHARAALATLTRLRGPDHEETFRAVPPLVTALSETDRSEEALALAHASQQRAERALGPKHKLSAQLVGTVAHAMSFHPKPDWNQVVAWRRRSADLHAAAFGPEDRETLVQLSNLGAELMDIGKSDESVQVLDAVIEVRTRTLGADHPDTLVSIMNLGAAHSRLGTIDRSIATYEPLVESCKRVLGPLHPSTLTAMRNLAIGYFKAGRTEDAAALSREVYDGRAKSLGPEHSETLSALGMYTNALMMLKRPAEAEPLVIQHYETCRRVFGDRHPHTIQAITALYDLAEAKDDLKGMRRWAEELRGTEYEQEVSRQLKIAEDAAAAKVKGE